MQASSQSALENTEDIQVCEALVWVQKQRTLLQGRF
jgi:hypothetical protein